MSISNNIDGSAGGNNQLLDFLSLVTNPKIYEAKIKTLQEVTAEHQKFVDLVAPATEIMDLREKLKKEKADLSETLSNAKAKAEATIKEAQEKANGIIVEAQAKADGLIDEAKKASDDAKAAQSEARQDAASVKKAKVDYDNLSASLKAQQDQLAKTQADADAVKKAAEALRNDIIEKHTAFIKGL